MKMTKMWLWLLVLGAGLFSLILNPVSVSATPIPSPYPDGQPNEMLYHLNATTGAYLNTGGISGYDLNHIHSSSVDRTTAGYSPAFDRAPDIFGSRGAANSANTAQSDFQGAGGAFTYEAVIRLDNDTNFGYVLSRDGGWGNTESTTGYKSWALRVKGSNSSVAWFYAEQNGTWTMYQASLPTTGPNVFNTTDWFHVAVVYNGQENTADNLKIYWTKLGETATANEIYSGKMTYDIDGSITSALRVGFRHQTSSAAMDGQIDEVRLSTVARGPDDFAVLSIPEPGTLLLLGAGLLGFVGYVKRKVL